ncbi:hypothetical protein D0B54_21835 [Solimonas sp. K1W22B-7]|uniref:CHASE domain-containing protein n=1 Tax=Solimonas sp. K1W22B-7 TaxID=2303331 RepID=UPI000E333C2F|nr:CHASE domain-containing protein [Solimonas sp. K1W22B-7]AXQ31154.1 hypothetical protein D0B54_21835 [Solimonas sp. K1W22B-7]
MNGYLVRVAVLTAAYALAGRLGLLLAIPPGYATAIWPAAGVALAGLMLLGRQHWPGVLLGSFIVNVSTSWDGGSAALVARSLSIAGAIAAGATLQALLGEWLVRRYVGYRNILTQETEAVRLLLLGGPLSCVVNALIGPWTLWFAGLIATPALLFNMWTWWVGDSIGVLIFVPLICAWTLRPIRTWIRQQLALTLPLLLLVVLVVILFFSASAREEQRIRSGFEQQAQQVSENFERQWSNRLLTMDAIRGFYAASSAVDAREFHLFVEKLLLTQPGLQALEFLPRVTQAERAGFEQAMRAAGDPDFAIREAGPDGHLRVAAAREHYYPIVFIEPPGAVRGVAGFDLASEALRNDTLQRAVKSGRSAVSAQLRLIHPIDAQGLLVMTPLFRGTMDYPSAEAREQNLVGVALAVFRIDAMVQAAIGNLDATGIRFRLLDQGAAPADKLLFDSGPPPGGGGIAMSHADTLEVGGRHWRLVFDLPAAYLVEHRSWQTWGLLAAGLGLSALLALLLLVVLARQSRVQELVTERTAELQKAELRLMHYAAELERSNAELQQFAYAASHDLQAPLRSIIGFSQILQRQYKGRLDEDADEFLQFIGSSATRMQALILDLLSLSRVGSGEFISGVVDLEEVLQQAQQNLLAEIQARDALLTHEPLPTIRGNRGQVLQLLQNLLANAMKFQRSGERPRVQVSAERAGSQWRLSVRDNGIGIAPEFHERIFQIFQRLHTIEEYEGTGIGLTLCRKIVERHGGRLWLESSPGQGATFFFTLPAVDAGDEDRAPDEP